MRLEFLGIVMLNSRALSSYIFVHCKYSCKLLTLAQWFPNCGTRESFTWFASNF